MITGKFLTSDDLGSLGRLAERGKLLVLDPGHNVPMLQAEREWIGQRYQEADRRSRTLRARLRQGERVREAFEVWTIEAAKLALCDRYLRAAEARLISGEPAALNLPRNWCWEDIETVGDLIRQVLDATDDEISGGAVFRVSA